MEEENQKIIGYRFDCNVTCPECHEALRDHESQAKPIRQGEINGYVCARCQRTVRDVKVLEAAGEKVQQMQEILPYRYRPSNLEDLEIIIRCCAEKISFLSTFFIQKREVVEMSEDDESGLYAILDQTREDLNFVLAKLEEMKMKGLIIEKKQEAA